MSWRTVVISNSAKLDCQMGYLIVRNQDVIKIHISEISILMIETTSVSLTAALLCELTKKKIKVIFCDEKRNPSSELVPYYGSHDTSMKVRKQIAWSEDIKTSVWTEIVPKKFGSRRKILRDGISRKLRCFMNILHKLNLEMELTGRGMQPKFILMHYLVWILQDQPKTV